jgi:hypothetical protein
MEAIMLSSITQLVIGIAVAIGIAVVSVGAIGSAVAQSPIEKAPLTAPTDLNPRFRKLTSGSVIVSSSESIFLMGATGSGEVVMR